MIYFGKEGDKLENGLNVIRVSDGGLSLKFQWFGRMWFFRERIGMSPKFLWGKQKENVML
jgi:hypothetical protein